MAKSDDAAKSAARAANLRYVNDDESGFRRRKCGRGFTYATPDGVRITDRATLDRIRTLAIPPAWTDVWICADERGHLQATGRDARGRKQYRYHPRWREVRDAAKFDHLIDFARALPAIRKRVDEDLGKRGLPRDKVLAAVVRLLDETLVRVGNEEYARDNQSFGLATLRPRHASVNGSTIDLSFRGKSGIHRRVSLCDRRLARVIARCQDVSGQRLFSYIGDDGEPHDIESDDVNEYLRAASGEDITSKDFRTWSATVLAAQSLQVLGPCRTQTARKKRITAAVSHAAEALGNTPAVCRKCYVHPAVIDCYEGGSLCSKLERCRTIRRGPRRGLDPAERMVLHFLHQSR